MSGPIWGINGSLDQGMVTINGVGWLETLQKKILYNTADYTNGGYGIPADEIAFGLLNRINSQYIGRADDLPDAPLLVKPGNVFGGPLENRNRYYVLGQALGPALQDMSDIEAGYDYVVDPDTRELNLYNWDYSQLAIMSCLDITGVRGIFRRSDGRKALLICAIPKW